MGRWRENYAELLSKIPHRVGAELGVLRGENSISILKNLPRLELLYCVDKWGGKAGPKNKQTFLDNLGMYRDKVKIMHMTTGEAADHIDDESLDFVFIDANHRYESVVEDIKTWVPKVKSGGLISGHDYIDYKKKGVKSGYNVKKAVDEIFPDANIRGTVWWTFKK